MSGFWYLILGLSILFVSCVSFFLIACADSVRSKGEAAERRITVIPVSGRRPDLEKRVRAWMRAERRRDANGAPVLCLVDCGADRETARLCACLSRRWEGIVFLSESDFENVFLRELLVANRERV